jgi:hypothetical protein
MASLTPGACEVLQADLEIPVVSLEDTWRDEPACHFVWL